MQKEINLKDELEIKKKLAEVTNFYKINNIKPTNEVSDPYWVNGSINLNLNLIENNNFDFEIEENKDARLD